MAAEIMYGLNSYLTFRIGNEIFGVNIGNVIKIIELSDITKVPDSPRHFKGIINHFGNVLPVFDGRIIFGVPAIPKTSRPCILVLVLEVDGPRGLGATAGLVVDGVEKVLIFEGQQIQTPGVIEKGYNIEWIHGTAMWEDECVMILNIDKIFSEEEINLKNAIE